jgi:membrane protein YdbS with pleckstrin-like domain
MYLDILFYANFVYLDILFYATFLFFIDALDLHRAIRYDLHLSTSTVPSSWCHHREATVSINRIDHITSQAPLQNKVRHFYFYPLHILRGC